MRMIEIVCENCGKSFERRAAEVKRSRFKKLSITCSRTCGSVMRNHKCSKGNLKNLIPKKIIDKWSPLRFMLSQCKAKAKSRGKSFCLSLTDLVEQWEKQSGICPYTGYGLIFPSETTRYVRRKASPFCASIDRIDSEKGYEKGNFEFVCLVVNYAKNGFSKAQMLEFFRNIKH